MGDSKPIKVKAMCLVLLDGHVCVADGRTIKSNGRSVYAGNFYRVIGGSLNFGEASETGVRREVREELKTEIENLERVDVIENLFEYKGEQEHEIVFLYKGTPERKDWDMQKSIHIIEDGYEFDAVWVPIETLLQGEIALYPLADYKKYLGV